MPTSDDLIVSIGVLLRSAGPRPQAARSTRVEQLGQVWQREVDATVTRWQAEVGPLWAATAERQIEAGVHADSAAAIAAMRVEWLGTPTLVLLDGMRTMAGAGAANVVDEARAAGVDLAAPPPLASTTLAEWARVTAELLATGYAAGLAREALRLFRPGATAADVVGGVRAYLDGLTDRWLRDPIGGALTRAQNLGRADVYARRPPGWELRLYADETLDRNTCGPCREIDGTLLPTLDAAMLAYGGAGYLYCLGRERCRGTMRGEWTRIDHTQPEQAAGWPLRGELMALRHET